MEQKVALMHNKGIGSCMLMENSMLILGTDWHGYGYRGHRADVGWA